MARRKTARKAARPKSGRKRAKARASVKRPKAKALRTRKRPRKVARRSKPAKAVKAAPRKAPDLNRERRRLADDGPETLRTPPSSLDLDRHGSAARTGRAEREQSDRNYGKMRTVTAGDPDADVDNAYFSGDETPGGDNSTPGQDLVDDIGHALGVEYADNEELRSGDKLEERDKHRWELDPASAEDYRDRD